MKMTQFLQDDNGRFSNARLGNFLVIIGFVADYFAHIYRAIEFQPSWSIVSIVAAIMGIKVAQKYIENKSNGKP